MTIDALQLIQSTNRVSLPSEQYGEFLLQARKRENASLEQMAHLLAEHGITTTPATLSKYENQQIKKIPVSLLRAVAGFVPADGTTALPHSTRKLRVAWAPFPDHAFLRCLPSVKIGNEPTMDSIEFIQKPVGELLPGLLDGSHDVCCSSEWRIHALADKITAIDRLNPPEVPIYRIRNFQVAVTGKLDGIHPWMHFFFEGCERGFQRQDQVGYALAKTISQIAVDGAPSPNKSEHKLLIRPGIWMRFFETLVEIANSWVLIKGEKHGLSAADIQRLAALSKAAKGFSDVSTNAADRGALQYGEDLNNMLKGVTGKQTAFFLGNLGIRLVNEHSRPMPTLIHNDAIEEITALAPLLNQGKQASDLADLFFQPHHIVARQGLDLWQRQEVTKLQKRWNYLAPRIAAGRAQLQDANAVVDAVLQGNSIWSPDLHLFEKLIRLRCIDLLMWV